LLPYSWPTRWKTRSLPVRSTCTLIPYLAWKSRARRSATLTSTDV